MAVRVGIVGSLIGAGQGRMRGRWQRFSRCMTSSYTRRPPEAGDLILPSLRCEEENLQVQRGWRSCANVLPGARVLLRRGIVGRPKTALSQAAYAPEKPLQTVACLGRSTARPFL